MCLTGRLLLVLIQLFNGLFWFKKEIYFFHFCQNNASSITDQLEKLPPSPIVDIMLKTAKKSYNPVDQMWPSVPAYQGLTSICLLKKTSLMLCTSICLVVLETDTLKNISRDILY